jgi:hypothetical protein
MRILFYSLQMICRNLIISFLVFFSISAYAQDKPPTDDLFEDIIIRDHLDQRILTLNKLPYFADREGEITFEQILEMPDDQLFQYNPNYNPRQFIDNANYWIRLDLRVDSVSHKYWLIEFYDQTIDEIEVFKPLSHQATAANDFIRLPMGDSRPFDERAFQHKNFEVMMNPSTPGHYTYYIKIRSHRFADIRIALRSVNRFVFWSLNEYFLFGLLYGMILIISIYNALMYTIIREKKYLYYIFYILSVGIYAMCVDGIAFQYLWPNFPAWNEIAYGVFLYFIILFALLFTKKFLITRVNTPTLDKVLIGLIVVRSFVFLYGLLIDNDIFEHRITDIMIMAFIFYTGFAAWKKGFQPARFFVIAYGVCLFHLKSIPGFQFKSIPLLIKKQYLKKKGVPLSSSNCWRPDLHISFFYFFISALVSLNLKDSPFMLMIYALWVSLSTNAEVRTGSPNNSLHRSKDKFVVIIVDFLPALNERCVKSISAPCLSKET